MFKPLRQLLIAFAIAALILGGCGWALNKRFQSSLSTKTDPKFYPEIVAEKKVSGAFYYDFLPKLIPADAEDVVFRQTPGFLQGGDSITLRVRLPLDRLRELLRELEKSGRKEVVNFEPAPTPLCYPRFGMTASDIPKGHISDLSPLPPDFRIFLNKTDLQDIAENWNHNFMAFTAVSLERREVVYHVDNW